MSKCLRSIPLDDLPLKEKEALARNTKDVKPVIVELLGVAVFLW
jgi:hypothetical protein